MLPLVHGSEHSVKNEYEENDAKIIVQKKGFG